MSISKLASVHPDPRIGNDVTFEPFATIYSDLCIDMGAQIFMAGASLVRKSVRHCETPAREPLSYIGVNVVGLRRRGFADDAIARIVDIYREIFVRNNNVDRAVQNVEQLMPRS